MKIAISTITDYGNYGNRLQNYALQKILEKHFDAEVLTIKNLTCIPRFNKKERFINALKDGSILKKVAGRVFTTKDSKIRNDLDYRRSIAFKEFTEEFIKETSEVNQNTKDFSSFSVYDLFIIGSDQVWNYDFDRFSELDFVPYALSNQKVISYAASFGVSKIPSEMKSCYINGLNNLDTISVREQSGLEIVKELVSRDAQVVLDPTMLLSIKDWEVLMGKSKISLKGEKYILTYFLGNPSDEERLYIRQYAELNKLKIYNLGDPSDDKCWVAGPIDFVKLIYNAEAVFTDSFHACIFSIIFEKYFEVFDRNSNLESMNSRIDTLLTTFNLSYQKHDFNQTKRKIDYYSVNKILQRKKELSFVFLSEQIKRI
ncbi:MULTISPECIES: polysaccharide pyruvyl transferase family protein [Enterococcus]|uniref:polysaccharide pyruvyl transferase family protein n=1 Tax=Enterococcus TaxID=1350 RepID=UPI000ECB2001|nr:MULTISPECIES: polysaccharide pyruvyl transferase family protein [Enterococcus]HCM85013.1 polysaccharide pyruvyl transferase family protein [Enterococcus sp.]